MERDRQMSLLTDLEANLYGLFGIKNATYGIRSTISWSGIFRNRRLSKKISSRYYRVLTMVYNTQRYWVFGLCSSSGFFLNNNEKHNVSETGSVSVLR
jgi:hypothetical protein